MNTNYLEVSTSLVNEKVKFECRAPGRESLYVDYTPPIGNGEGFTSLELLLASLATCVGTTVKGLVEKKLGEKVLKLDINAKGKRREAHPTYIEAITLDIGIACPGLEEKTAKEIIDFGRKAICPVINMLGSTVSVDIGCRILQSEVMNV